MNLVVGASGLVGMEICHKLIEDGKPVRALVRRSTDPAKRERLQSFGADLAYGDLKEPETLDVACRGISTVISTASSTLSRQVGDSIESVDAQGQLNLIRAAKTAGAHHFIFISFPPTPVDFALERAKRTVEKTLDESGLVYTILQPTFFSEVWLSPAVGFDIANAKATIYGSGLNEISWISYQDVARFAAASVDNGGARNAVIKLGGLESLSPLQVVRIFEQVGRRRFTVTHVDEDALKEQKAAAGDSIQEAFAALMLYYAHGDVIDMKPASRIFGIEGSALMTVLQYARRAVHGGES